ncbi:MAG: DUF4352 domain-containing protein [Clostridia bacterium]|nr:DUF4352 domain-containing protein [Clostridia bacterium]
MVYSVGEVASDGDVDVTLVNVMESDGGSSYTPNDGNIYLICEFKVVNHSDDDLTISSMLSFSTTCDSKIYPIDLEALGIAMFSGKPQMDTVVEPGKSFSGVVGYQVPKGWKDLQVLYTSDLFSGSSFTFVANR